MRVFTITILLSLNQSMTATQTDIGTEYNCSEDLANDFALTGTTSSALEADDETETQGEEVDVLQEVSLSHS